MRISFTDVSVLKKALKLAAGGASNKSTIPALTCILIDASGVGAAFTGYDLQSGVTVAVTDGVTVEEDGKCLVSAKTLADIVSAAARDKVVFESDGKKLKVSTGNGMKFELLEQDVSTYPALPEVTGNKSFKIPFGRLKDAIDTTLFACAPDDEINLQKGCCFTLSLKDENLEAVGVDGYRVAVNRSKVENPDDVEFVAKIPRVIAAEVAKYPFKDDDEVKVCYDLKTLIFKMEGTKIFGRLYTGTTFDVNSIKLPDAEVGIVTADLLDAVAALKPLATARARTVIMTVMGGKAKLKMTTELGSAETEVPLQNADNLELVIGFNLTYLLEAASHIASETVKASITSPTAPIKIIDGENNEFIVLPVRVNA